MPNTGPDNSQQATSISKNDAFYILQNPRRRAVLRYLLEHEDEEQFTLSDLTEEVAAWEHETTVQELTYDERQRVYISLYQSHLPALDEYGIIEYDKARGTVAPTPLINVFDSYLDAGLHDATDYLSVGDTDESDSNKGLADALSELFRG